MANYFIILSCYCLLLSVINISAASVAKENISSTSESQKGKCIPIQECPLFLNLLKKRPLPADDIESLRRAGCGFAGVSPKVYCPLNTVEEADSTTPQTPVATLVPPIPETPISHLLPDLNVCGLFTEDRIVIGDESQLDGYPWTVLLEYETPNGNGFHCGGVLINNRYVLTAAQCISGKGVEENWKLVNVRLGEYDRDSDQDCDSFLFSQSDCCCADDVINVGIEEKIVHEQYDPSNKTQYYDIALLRLAKNVKFTDFVRPICLQPVKYLTNGSLPGEPATISGWGVSKLSSNSKKKQWAKMQIKNNVECESVYAKKGLHLREDQICAFVDQNHKNSCSQDNGGALMTDNHNAFPSLNYFAIGVKSISHPICGLKEYPVTYTKVENYVPWIISKLKP